MSVYLSVNLSVDLSFYPSVCYMFVYLSVDPTIYHSVYSYICLSICYSVCLSIHLKKTWLKFSELWHVLISQRKLRLHWSQPPGTNVIKHFTSIIYERSLISQSTFPCLAFTAFSNVCGLSTLYCTILHYGFVIYWFRSKLVCLSKPVKVTDNRKGTSLLRNLSIFRILVQAPGVGLTHKH
jgi:hypothetical protein